MPPSWRRPTSTCNLDTTTGWQFEVSAGILAPLALQQMRGHIMGPVYAARPAIRPPYRNSDCRAQRHGCTKGILDG
jgi:hypothetical protein